MASYELQEEDPNPSKITLEAGVGFILLEESTGPEGWVPVDQDTQTWTPVARVTV